MFQTLMTSLYSYLHALTINNIFAGRHAYWATKASEARQGAKSATTRRIEQSEIDAGEKGTARVLSNEDERSSARREKRDDAAY